MQDRVPGAPGQYTATITATELAKLLASETFTITLTRDDQPITEGTPYNKASVLPDDVAAVVCPDIDNPTPADAFQALAEKIGGGDYVPLSGGTMTGTLRAPNFNLTAKTEVPGFYIEPSDIGVSIGTFCVDRANRRIRMVQYAEDMDNASTRYGEIYHLPAANSGLTKWDTYNILTTKTVTYGTDDPGDAVGAAGVAGRIYFKKVES